MHQDLLLPQGPWAVVLQVWRAAPSALLLVPCTLCFSVLSCPSTPAVQYAVLSRTAHLETHTGNISHGVSATTESCNQNLVLQTAKWAQSSSTVSKMQNSACSPGPARRCALRASHDSKRSQEGGRNAQGISTRALWDLWQLFLTCAIHHQPPASRLHLTGSPADEHHLLLSLLLTIGSACR